MYINIFLVMYNSAVGNQFCHFYMKSFRILIYILKFIFYNTIKPYNEIIKFKLRSFLFKNLVIFPDRLRLIQMFNSTYLPGRFRFDR